MPSAVPPAQGVGERRSGLRAGDPSPLGAPYSPETPQRHTDPDPPKVNFTTFEERLLDRSAP